MKRNLNLESRIKILENTVLKEGQTNVEKLQSITYRNIDFLGEVREAFGAKSPEDTSRDSRINQARGEDLIGVWCEYNIGDVSWWTIMKKMYDILK